MGMGAAPEGVISAAAMRALGGHFQGQLVADPAVVMTKEWANKTKEENIARLKEMNITDPDRVYECEELASGERCCLLLRHHLWYADGRCALFQGRRPHAEPRHLHPV
jgi:D-fructose 1,6-bisphosphatase (EC 3.1.3.11)/sedoheptulose 1,7-bisphosphatase (EC 3.1.3.37)